MIGQAFAAVTLLALGPAGQTATGPQAPPPVATQQQPPPVIEVFRAGKKVQKPSEKVVLTPSRLDSAVSGLMKRMPTVAPQWKVECGIKVIVVNPDIDPQMIVTPQPGAAEPKIRRISPPPCPERR